MISKINIISEIGINHNGDIALAKKLIDLSAIAGCDFVKFQKRNPDVCVPDNQKSVMRETPWGEMTYLEYKWKIEFSESDYDEINSHCKSHGIQWFASVWDAESVDFMKKYRTEKGVTMKIPSALITDVDLCKYAREHSDYLMISTGMSTEKEIEKAVIVCDPNLIFHTNSTYPCPVEELNLSYIKWLKDKYTKREIGYSGHEYGLVTTHATIGLGATWIERHITLNRNMWGSDQSSSVEPSGLIKLVKGVRDIESAMGAMGPRHPSESELKKMKTLRK
tara:strand:- start:3752 stop:4588 length:837 start_codon:yes stop_codon:yes gene_type:complete